MVVLIFFCSETNIFVQTQDDISKILILGLSFTHAIQDKNTPNQVLFVIESIEKAKTFHKELLKFTKGTKLTSMIVSDENLKDKDKDKAATVNAHIIISTPNMVLKMHETNVEICKTIKLVSIDNFYNVIVNEKLKQQIEKIFKE